MLKIAIEGINLHGNHGVYAEERKRGTQFVIDVYLLTGINTSVESDDLSHTVDYQAIYELVVEKMAHPVNLLERLAFQIGQEVLERFKGINSVTVKVAKIKPLEMEKCDQTSVEIYLENNFPTS